jgi:hypothetical protein
VDLGEGPHVKVAQREIHVVVDLGAHLAPEVTVVSESKKKTKKEKGETEAEE